VFSRHAIKKSSFFNKKNSTLGRDVNQSGVQMASIEGQTNKEQEIMEASAKEIAREEKCLPNSTGTH